MPMIKMRCLKNKKIFIERIKIMDIKKALMFAAGVLAVIIVAKRVPVVKDYLA